MNLISIDRKYFYEATNMRESKIAVDDFYFQEGLQDVKKKFVLYTSNLMFGNYFNKIQLKFEEISQTF